MTCRSIIGRLASRRRLLWKTYSCKKKDIYGSQVTRQMKISLQTLRELLILHRYCLTASCDRPGEGSSEKNCCLWLTFRQPERKSSSESSEKSLSVDDVISLVRSTWLVSLAKMVLAERLVWSLSSVIGRFRSVYC